MKKVKTFLLLAIVALVCNAYTGSAQVFVTVRPPLPHYERVVAPSPRHIWIDEEWEPRGGAYVFVGGHWAMPPYEGAIWVPGRWRHGPRGEYWVRGRWDHRGRGRR